MTRPIARTELSGGEQAQWGLLALCLFILAAGTTLPQRLAGMNSIINYSPSESLYGVLSAGVMIFACIILVLWNASRRGGRAYRPTGIEAGLGLLLAAGLLGIFLASDKRTAVNHLVFIIAPMFMGILLVQLLDSAAKVKVLLYTMVALGIVNTYECADQFFFSNEVMVQQYKEDPLAMLAKVGIQPDSYQHMMFEHHLKSRDVRGFFSTSNSSGSFLLLALFAAMALLVEGRSLHLSGRATVGEMVGKYLALAAVAFGLLLTQSKGAIGSAIISCVLLLVWHLFRDWLTRHRTATVLCAAATVVAVWTGIIAYGTTHDTLPGGKSMLVRWQYWTGAARMYADHPLGVGGGNFAVWYPTYKIPAAPETVKDPHNFVLSFLTQYGPLGLFGFLAAIFGALRATIFRRGSDVRNTAISGGFNRLVWGIVPAVLLGLLIVRPLILTYEVGTNMAVAVVVVVFLLLLPLVFFAVTFLLLSVRDDVGAFPDTAQAMLTIGLIGVIIHNCIDFALFEPGIMAFIWACAAAIVSLDFIRGKRSPRQVTISGNRRWAAWGAAALGATAFVWFVLIPVPATEFLKAQASLALDNGDIAEARRLYGIATDVDKLSSEAPHSAGRLYLFEFRNSFPDLQLIDAAERAIHTAIDRNPAAHEYRAMLAEVYATAAQIAQGDVRTAWLEKAHSAATEAVIRYPGDAAARIALADIADDLGRTDEALEQYIEAVAIERAYRELFVRMHPDRELHSRLGENKYQYARSRIAELSARSD